MFRFAEDLNLSTRKTKTFMNMCSLVSDIELAQGKYAHQTSHIGAKENFAR